MHLNESTCMARPTLTIALFGHQTRHSPLGDPSMVLPHSLSSPVDTLTRDDRAGSLRQDRHGFVSRMGDSRKHGRRSWKRRSDDLACRYRQRVASHFTSDLVQTCGLQHIFPSHTRKRSGQMTKSPSSPGFRFLGSTSSSISELPRSLRWKICRICQCQ